MFYHTRTAVIDSLSELGFKGLAATSELQEDGYALDMAGADLSRFEAGNAPLLWQHNPNIVLGRIPSIWTTATALPFEARFASPGISNDADEKRLLLKDGNLGAISLGFSIEKTEPINPGSPRTGLWARKWTALEVSLVAVGMDPKAVVTTRSRAFRSVAEVRRWASSATAPSSLDNPYTYDPNCPLPMVERLARWNMAHFNAVIRAGLPDADFEQRQAELRRRRAAAAYSR